MAESETEKPKNDQSDLDGQAKNGKSAISALGATSLLTFVILSLCWIVGFASRLFAIIRFESIIHEFDPWWV